MKYEKYVTSSYVPEWALQGPGHGKNYLSLLPMLYKLLASAYGTMRWMALDVVLE